WVKTRWKSTLGNHVELFARFHTDLDESVAIMEHLCEALGHKDRESGFKGYCRALMLPIRRTSVEPMAAQLQPEHVSARHQ
ncbi:transposase, partial [Burkholderia cenocepacia]|nr:transposase [Burkholderia cenocepacia]